MKKIRGWLITFTWIVLTSLLDAHVGSHPSIHDTVAGIVERLKRQKSDSELKALTLAKVERFLTPLERHVLATEHLSFRVDVPVKVSVVRSIRAELPFWLQEQNFQPTYFRMRVGDEEFDVWQKEFGAGWIGLGVNSLSGGGSHYFVTITPRNSRHILSVQDLYPGQARVGIAKAGEKPYVDGDQTIKYLPAELEGQALVRTAREWNNVAKLLNLFHFTTHRSSNRPDQVVLTWGGDPRTTQSIQWRTGPGMNKGIVAYQKKAAYNRFRPEPFRYARAESARITTPFLLNDPIMFWHSVNLKDLEPNTTYVYSVGNGKKDGWTELTEFTTAPVRVKPFSFVYMGDAQNGLDRWGTLVRSAFRRRPDAAFYVMAGDMVNRGAERDDWDSLFYNAQDVYNRRQLVPVIGNHECQGGHPTLYLKYFNLPKNGPPLIEPKRVYALEYSNALLLVLDSNLKPESQTEWIEEQLSKTKATWKFVTYHHPAYSSGKDRDNKDLREKWTPIFDKYHVDLALQGHDHAYLRTYPMNGTNVMARPKDGTIYIISYSGTKGYDQAKHHYAEIGITNIPTYQVLDLQISGDRLVYQAYDIDGKLRDEFAIQK